MKPRKNYRTRPKKHGAAKRQRVLAQKRRLIAAGYDEETLRHKTTAQIRELLKASAKKKSKKAPMKKAPTKKKLSKRKQPGRAK